MIGIVILNYKTWNDTVKCVESIIETAHVEYKIYVVDNNSPDDSYIQLKSKFNYFNNVCIVKSYRNGGYSAGNNIGIRLALSDGADALLLTNSDIIFFENAIDSIYKCILDNPQVGVVGPKVLLQDGGVQHLIRENYTFFNYIFSKKPLVYLKFLNINNKTMYGGYKYDNDLLFFGCLSGCCICLSTKCLEKIGLLDESIFLYYEEAIIGYKAKQNNMLTCFKHEACVLHKSSSSIGSKNSAFSRFHRYYSSLYVLRKYVGINSLEYTLVFLINYIPFLLSAIVKNEYRLLLKKFTKSCLKLYRVRRVNICNEGIDDYAK